jgi:transcriptional antiterminator RfaH
MQQISSTKHATACWYVVHCKPHKESQTASALRDSLALPVYHPEVRRYVQGRLEQAPLFPRYLFVQANLREVKLSSINTTPGVVRLVAFGDVPQPVSVAVVESLRQRVDYLNQQGGLLGHGFQPGQTVRLRGGPLQGMEAIFVGPMRPSERVQVLIEFLGRLNEVKVVAEELEDANTAPVPGRVRYTRGKGRRINNPNGQQV